MPACTNLKKRFFRRELRYLNVPQSGLHKPNLRRNDSVPQDDAINRTISQYPPLPTMTRANSSSSRHVTRPARKRGKFSYRRGMSHDRAGSSERTQVDPLPVHTSEPPRAPRHMISGASSEHVNSDVASPSVINSALPAVASQSNPSMQAGSDSPMDSELRTEIEKIRREKYDMAVTLNEYKQKLQHMEVKKADDNLTLQICKEKVIMLNAEISALKLERDGLQKLVELHQSSVQRSGKVSSKFWDKIAKTLDPKYNALANALYKRLSSWCTAETMEIFPDYNGPRKRKWDGRAQSVDKYGLPLLSQNTDSSSALVPLFVPYPITAVLQSTELFYVQSYVSHEEILATELNMVLASPGVGGNLSKALNVYMKKLWKRFQLTKLWWQRLNSSFRRLLVIANDMLSTTYSHSSVTMVCEAATTEELTSHCSKRKKR